MGSVGDAPSVTALAADVVAADVAGSTVARPDKGQVPTAATTNVSFIVAVAVAVLVAAVIGVGFFAMTGTTPAAPAPSSSASASVPAPPIVGPIGATFAQPVTTYTVSATGTGLHFTWSNSNPCGTFIGGDSPSATWSHPDGTTPGSCPNEAVHAAAITVVVTDASYTCTAVYLSGSAPGTSLTSGSCVPKR